MGQINNTSRNLKAKRVFGSVILALWLLLTSHVQSQSPTPVPGAFAVVERSPDNTMLAGAGLGGIVVVYDITTGERIFTFDTTARRLLALTWSPDARRIAVSGSEPFIYVLCVDQQIPAQCTPGSILTTIAAHEPYVLDIDWSPDGTRIASVNQQDQALKIWNADTYQLVNTLHGGDPYKVDWSPDSTQLAALDFTGYAWIVDASLERSTLRFVGAEGQFGIPVYALAWSPDGEQLALGRGIPQSEEGLGEIEIWDTDQDLMVAEFQNLGDVVTTVSWSPDGSRLASYSTDRNVRVWDVANQQLISTVPVAENDLISSAGISWDASGSKVIFGGSEEILPVNLPTPIPTATFTPTDTLVNTATHTATATDTPTTTPTASFTPTSTPTNTPTATFTPTNEPITWQNEIVFASNRTGGYNLYRAAHDATTAVQLTTHGGSNFPVWSPDRQWIVYVKSADLWVLHVASQTTQAIIDLNTTSEEFSPTWSPAGNKIAFSSDRDGDSEIYVAYLTLTYNGGSSITISAGTATNITTNSAFDDRLPVWSPVTNSSTANYNRIAFRTTRGAGGNNEIYTILADGTDLTAVTSTAAGVNNTQPEWGPSGFWLAFASNLNGSNLDIYAVRYDATNGWLSTWRRLTNTSQDNTIMSWRGIDNVWYIAYTRIPASGNGDIRILEVEKNPVSVVATTIPDWNSTDDDTSPDW